ncbi:MAG: hypothetical protein RLZZ306_3087 [Bacteroidota bacterium]|jgi:hypothetical protein
MINSEGKLNLSTSGGSDLNQELVENSKYTKATSTSDEETMGNEGVESSNTHEDENLRTGKNSSKPNRTSMMGENSEDDDSFQTSEMNSKMNHERDAKAEINHQPTSKENTLTKSDVPYDIPDDQTPPMSDMPKNIEQMTKKSGYDEDKKVTQ